MRESTERRLIQLVGMIVMVGACLFCLEILYRLVAYILLERDCNQIGNPYIVPVGVGVMCIIHFLINRKPKESTK